MTISCDRVVEGWPVLALLLRPLRSSASHNGPWNTLSFSCFPGEGSGPFLLSPVPDPDPGVSKWKSVAGTLPTTGVSRIGRF